MKFSKVFKIFFVLVFFLLIKEVYAATTTVTYTSQAEFESAITSTGVDTTSDPGSATLNGLTITSSPATSTDNVALLVSDDTDIDADIDFIVGAYYPNFTYDGSGSDDVFDFTEITQLSDLSGYDIVISDSDGTSQAADVPQDILDSFADAGGTVMQDILEYSYQRQADTYTQSISFDLVPTSTGDITWDGTYIWMVDDTSPEKIYKINSSTGAVVSTYCSPDAGPHGILYANSNLYITDTTNDKIFVISPDNLTTYDGVCTAPAQGTAYSTKLSSGGFDPSSYSPWGITYDGTYFWLIDSTTDNLYKFTFGDTTLNQISSTTLGSFLTLTPNDIIPRGLAFDGTDIWLADSNNNLLYQISPTNTEMLGAFDAYDGWDGYTDADPTGITFINGDIWIADPDATVDKLYNLSSYHRDMDAFEYFNKGNTSFETPYDDPKGLAYDGTYFWLIDDYTNKIFKMTTSGTVVSSYFTPSKRPNGIAYYDGTLYLSDWGEDLIYLLDPSDCSVSSSYSSPGSSSRGLAHDGTYLWNADSSSDIIYKLNPATGSIISTTTSPGPTPRGLAFHNNELWVADETDDKYYKINSSTGDIITEHSVSELSAEGIAFIGDSLYSVDDIQDRIYDVYSDLLSLSQYDTPGSVPAGFTYDGTYIWALDSGTDKLYKLTSSTGAVITSYDSPALNPADITWDGTYLWILTTDDDNIYQINPTNGATISSFSTPSSNPVGLVYVDNNFYTSDPITNKIYSISTTGTLLATYDAPGSNAGTLAYDGTSVYHIDNDERQIFQFIFDDDYEGIVESAQEPQTTQVKGIEFIDGVLWTVDSYFDSFFNNASLNDEPNAVIAVENAYTVPYDLSDYFYFSSRNITDAFYLQRRLENVPETGGREILASSNRGGAVFIHEARTNNGHIFTMDLSLLGDNYEISRQTVPAVNLFLNALGIQTNASGVHENTKPTYDSLDNDLDTLVSNYPTLFTKKNEGVASNGDPIYSYNFGSSDKPWVIFVSGVHGTEEHAFIPEVRFMEKLGEWYATDEIVQNVFENYYIKFIPLVNPYGIKNYTRYNANGVDINRNYDYEWDNFYSSYKGSSAFSEAESQVLRDIILNNIDDIIFINDAHSAMAISPGMTWGGTLVTSTPSLLTDTYDIFTGTNNRRWFDERAGVGRWLTYDRYTNHTTGTPFFGNWIGDQGIYSSTNEVMGKKDIGTNRMIHSSGWYITHFYTVFESLSAKTGKSIFRVDTSNSNSTFAATASSTATTPASTTIAYRYTSSDTTTASTTWYNTYSNVPADRYLFVETSLNRGSYTQTPPALSSLSIQYSEPNIDPDTPTNTTPTNGSTGSVATSTTLTASAFSDTDGGTHSSSQWLVTATSSDYTSTIYDSGTDNANLTSITIPSTTLSNTTTYYWKVRYLDSDSGWSDYSSETSFTTINNTPATPVNSTPANGATSVSADSATLTASAFSDTDSTHTSSQWQVSTVSGNYSTTVYDSNTDSVNLITINIPSGTLSEGTTYYWHARYLDSDGTWSSYSTETSFTTTQASTPSTPSSGGVSIPAEAFLKPLLPKNGYKILINNINSENPTVYNKNIKINSNVGSDVKKIAISENEDFRNASQEKYEKESSYILSEGAGTKKLYIRFYTKWGVASETITKELNYKIKTVKESEETETEEKTEEPKPTTPTNKYTFASYLYIGSVGDEVRELQKLLEQLGYYNYPSITGYFGNVTKQALVGFQKAKGLSPFPGWMGPGTRDALNSL